MTNKQKWGLLKNAVANVVRGGAVALVAVLLPPFLTRLMSSEAYGAWSLVLQISAFVGYLDFGIQTAIGRFVARTEENRETEHRDRIVSTSMAALIAAGTAGLAGSAGLALLLPRVFQQLPQTLIWDCRLALILVGGSLAIGLPCSVFNGIFVGLQRYEVPAAIVGSSRLLGAFALVLVTKHGGNLTQMAAAVAIVNLAAYGLQYLLYRVMAPRMTFSPQLVSRKTGRELFDYCLSLSIWSFAMLLVSGLDVSLVGYFEFEKVAYYAVASTLITFLSGIQYALFNVMIPSTAAMQIRENSIQLGKTMITATRYGSFVLLLVGLPLAFAARGVLSYWVGAKYAAEGALILQVLATANMIRLSAVPYVMTLIGTGQQRLVIITPLLEGVCNLMVSAIAGYFFGAVGVAIGTLAGAIVGTMGNVVYNMPRTTEIEFRITDYLRDGLLRPLVCSAPLTATVLILHWFNAPPAATAYAAIGSAVLATAFLVWRFGLIRSEREKLWARHFVAEG